MAERNQEATMDWDEARTPRKQAALLGEDLAKLSVADLEARVAELLAEVERVKAEINTRKAHSAAVENLFKR